MQRGTLQAQGASGWGQALRPTSWEARLEGNKLQSGGVRAGVSSNLGPHRTFALRGPTGEWAFPGGTGP